MTRILMLDDAVIYQKLVRKALEPKGYELHVASTVSQAEQQLRRRKYDLLIVDYWLAEGTAIEAVDKLRKAGRLPPFIVFTGSGDEQVAVQFMKAGAADYLLKSDKILDELPVAVERILRESRLRRGFSWTALAIAVLLCLVMGLYARHYRAAWQAQTRQNERWTCIIDEALIPFIVVQETGKVSLWNHGAERFLGYSREEALGRDLDFIIPEECRQSHAAGFADALERGTLLGGDVLVLDVTLIAKDGSRKPCRVQVAAVSNSHTWYVAQMLPGSMPIPQAVRFSAGPARNL